MAGNRVAREFLRDLLSVYWLLRNGVTGLFALVLAAAVLLGLALVPVGIGFPIVVVSLRVVRWFADRHRRWAGRVLDVELAGPYYQSRPDWSARGLWECVRDETTWADFVWLLVHGLTGLAGALVLPPLWFVGIGLISAVQAPDVLSFIRFVGPTAGVVVFLISFWSARRLCRIQAVMSRVLLAPTRRTVLAQRVTELAVSRASTVDAQAAELSRIERDLHDGAQARLISLTMGLGLAEESIRTDPDQAIALVVEARRSAAQALTELRDLVRGIHPPILADRGLAGGIEASALLSPVPVVLNLELPGRPEPPVESALYFATAEALANVTKHSGASRAWVRANYVDGLLRVVVGDNGHGGADPDGGSGLAGIRRRLSAFDGTLTVRSPAGGPTELIMDLPCQVPGRR